MRIARYKITDMKYMTFCGLLPRISGLVGELLIRCLSLTLRKARPTEAAISPLKSLLFIFSCQIQQSVVNFPNSLAWVFFWCLFTCRTDL